MTDSFHATDETVSEEVPPRRWFYSAAVLCVLLGIAADFVKVSCVSDAVVATATRNKSAVQSDECYKETEHSLRIAEYWQISGLSAIVFAMVSWFIAFRRGENSRGIWTILLSLLAMYLGLQFILV